MEWNFFAPADCFAYYGRGSRSLRASIGHRPCPQEPAPTLAVLADRSFLNFITESFWKLRVELAAQLPLESRDHFRPNCYSSPVPARPVRDQAERIRAL
jgi:hypothetical protein